MDFLLTVAALLLVPAAHGIFDGTNTTIREFPSLVSIERNGRQMCLGSIIDKSWVLTTAQCVNGYVNPIFRDGKYTVRAGSDKRNQSGTVHHFEKVHPHQNYTVKRVDSNMQLPVNDIALIKVKEPFTIDDTTKPAKIANKQADKVRVVGFSKYVNGSQVPEWLQWIDIPVLDQTVCNRNGSYNGGAMENGTVCAGPSDFKSDKVRACYGDEGAPVTVAGSLAGLVSVVYHCADEPYYPVLYTDVVYYRSWIDKYVQV